MIVGVFPVGDSDSEAVWMADRHYQGSGGERHQRPGLRTHIYHAVPTKVWPQNNNAGRVQSDDSYQNSCRIDICLQYIIINSRHLK